MDHQTMWGKKIRPTWIVAAGLAVLALVAVGIPLVSLLYVGILLLCPLMMVGMHGGNGRSHGNEDSDRSDRGESSDREASSAGDPPAEGSRA